MLDWTLYGGDPAGHHATNILLHAVNTLLTFLLFNVMTARLWPSAAVAALFALHPLHVESVAWVAERKDLLCALFALLATLAYVAYARRGGTLRYLLTALLLALSLAAKPMAVTLPLLFLLLDYWPLERRRSLRLLLLEKLPLALLSALSSIMTLIAQQKGGAVASTDAVAFPLRLANAAISCIRYILKTIWPAELSVFYPHPDLLGGSPWEWWQVGGACLLLAAVFLLVSRARSMKYLTVGWLWYLGMLVPVLGLVQVGPQAMADRYSYLPLTGLFLMVVRGCKEILPRRLGALLMIVLLIACGARSWVQLKHWRNSVVLFEHALEVTPGHPVIHNYLGTALERAGRHAEALEQYRSALLAAPGYAGASYNLGSGLLARGDAEQAIGHLRLAVGLDPRRADALTNLGNALAATGRLDEALSSYRAALEVDPSHVGANYNLGVALQRKGDPAAAIPHYRRMLRTEPDHPQAHNNLGLALAATGALQEAIEHFRHAIRIDPGHARARGNLEKALRQRGNQSMNSSSP
jgi:tetratricopeptide (TPR) repeat protein